MTRNWRRWLVSFFFLLCSAALMWSQARKPTEQPPLQAGQIRGQVTTPDGRPAWMGIAVYLEERGGGMVAQTQTDDRGKFEFLQVQPGVYEVNVRLRGYLEVRQNFDMITMPNAYAMIELRKDPAFKGPVAGPGGTVSVETFTIPSRARKDFESGKALLSKGEDLGKSIQFFKKATDEYPKYSEAYLLMGLAYTAQQQWKDADSSLRKAIELDVASAPAYMALGELQFRQQDYAGAEKSQLKAVELAPESADAHLGLARTYWAIGRWQDADPHAAKVVQLKPDNAGAHVLMGNISLRKRDGAGALKEFQEALRLAPDSPMAPGIREVVKKIEAATKNPKP